MDSANPVTTIKCIGDQLVAGIRFWGPRAEVPATLRKLGKAVAPYAAGVPLCLVRAGNEEHGYDLEACYPVSRDPDVGGVSCRVLEGRHLLCATHAFVGGIKVAATDLAAAWKALGEYVAKHQIDQETGPYREVYLQGATAGGDGDELVVELQVPILLPSWLSRLADGVKRTAGEQACAYVMRGSAGLEITAGAAAKAAWAQGAMQRLDEAVPDDQVREQVMADCAHRFPLELIASLKQSYQELGNLDALLQSMQEDAKQQGRPAYTAPYREGDKLLVTKVPYDPAGMEQAATAAERRARYCHCGLVRALIETGQPGPATFCHCGCGWHQQLWEGILDAPVRVELLKSVLLGDDTCEFAIHLPAGVVPA